MCTASTLYSEMMRMTGAVKYDTAVLAVCHPKSVAAVYTHLVLECLSFCRVPVPPPPSSSLRTYSAHYNRIPGTRYVLWGFYRTYNTINTRKLRYFTTSHQLHELPRWLQGRLNPNPNKKHKEMFDPSPAWNHSYGWGLTQSLHCD